MGEKNKNGPACFPGEGTTPSVEGPCRPTHKRDNEQDNERAIDWVALRARLPHNLVKLTE
jgi:hypothetical protein